MALVTITVIASPNNSPLSPSTSIPRNVKWLAIAPAVAAIAIVVPQPIFDIWPADQAMALLDVKSRPALCQHVSARDRTKLLHWDLVEEFSKADLLQRLRSNHLARL